VQFAGRRSLQVGAVGGQVRLGPYEYFGLDLWLGLNLAEEVDDNTIIRARASMRFPCGCY
jgi:hypothetical protein